MSCLYSPPRETTDTVPSTVRWAPFHPPPPSLPCPLVSSLVTYFASFLPSFLFFFGLFWPGAGEAQKAVDEATADVDAKRSLIKACELRLEEGAEKLRAKAQANAQALRDAQNAAVAARSKMEASRDRLQLRQVVNRACYTCILGGRRSLLPVCFVGALVYVALF